MVKFATIGTSWITESFILDARASASFELVGVYSRDMEKAKMFAKKQNAKMAYDDLEEMAKSDLIEAVYIASPNSLHGQQAELFLKWGKHVICEKPIVTDTEQLNHNIELAQKNNVLYMEAMVSPFLPNYEIVKANLWRLGKVRRYIGSYCQYSSKYDRFKSGELVNAFNPKFGGGALMDLGIYTLYPLIDLFGMPESIKAESQILDSGIDGAGSALLKYKEMDAVLYYSKISQGKNYSEIQGEEGTLLIDKIGSFEKVYFINLKGEIEDLSQDTACGRMYFEAKHFMETIEQHKSESPIIRYDLMKAVRAVLSQIQKQGK